MKGVSYKNAHVENVETEINKVGYLEQIARRRSFTLDCMSARIGGNKIFGPKAPSSGSGHRGPCKQLLLI